MPRAVVKKLFKEGELQNMEDIKTFANQYVVKAEMVNDYIKHLKNIEFKKQLRATVTKNDANTRKTISVVKKLFKEGELQIMEDIKTFANQYVVKAEMVNDYIKHLKNIEFRKQLRATVTKNEANTRKTKK